MSEKTRYNILPELTSEFSEEMIRQRGEASGIIETGIGGIPGFEEAFSNSAIANAIFDRAFRLWEKSFVDGLPKLDMVSALKYATEFYTLAFSEDILSRLFAEMAKKHGLSNPYEIARIAHEQSGEQDPIAADRDAV